MTVGEFIEELKKYPLEMHVVLNYEDGYCIASPEFEIEQVYFDGKKYTAQHYQESRKNKGKLIEVLELAV